jgi:preprotein translocase subunit YajC
VSVLLIDSMASMQPPPTGSPSTGAPSEPGPSGGGGGGAGGGFAALQPFVLMAVMFGVFYFLLIRPQQKRQRETDDMLKALRKGDKVRTSGGIRGEIVELTETDVTLRVDDKVKLNVLRSHIASRIDRPTEGGKGPEAKGDDTGKAKTP